MEGSIQSVQVRALVAKAAAERDEARTIANAYAVAWRSERNWNRALLAMVAVLTLTLIWVM